MFFMKKRIVKLVPILKNSVAPMNIVMVDKDAADDLHTTLLLAMEAVVVYRDGLTIAVSPARITDVIHLMESTNLLKACERLEFSIVGEMDEFRREYFIMAHHHITRADLESMVYHVLNPSKFRYTDEAEHNILCAAQSYLCGENMVYFLLKGLADEDITRYELTKDAKSQLLRLRRPEDITMDIINFIPMKLKDRFTLMQLP